MVDKKMKDFHNISRSCGHIVRLLYKTVGGSYGWRYYNYDRDTLHSHAEKLTNMLSDTNDEKIKQIAREELKKVLLDIAKNI